MSSPPPAPDRRQIVAGSAGLLRPGAYGAPPRFGPVARFALSLTGAPRPRVCWVGTAVGDDAASIARFYEAAAGEAVQATHLQLFPMPNADPTAQLLAADLIWVSGGSVVNLLAVWRAHGLDAILRQAWEQGVVLAGVSAGSLCWHTGGTTDSFGPQLRPVTDCLGLLPWSTGVHDDSEPARRPLYRHLVATGALGPGHATEDGVAVHYCGTAVADVVADTAGRRAYRVERGPDGAVVETALQPRLLGEHDPGEAAGARPGDAITPDP